ncbi:MocR-like pyridoxine biosynthesis transcription factor PdxR [Aliamphritea spongicola]|uniref:MocR-like pyridoxine biosynthesis transcription factor PdxR n=1 Tax=Aliamphritea spongicola TaxID=707589 RepID=UPI00196AC91F|nr:PLP-dependent aminotransferase family protein [Aliamphritea spongicola]MBN3563304.1 PLP-dependent aminotransferase family protein [Aliamphritea spongicola]
MHSRDEFPSELFLPFLSADSGPQYRALFRGFQQAILSGQLGPGSKLPASRPLGKNLGVSRNTVKAAYELLQAEGYIETRHGAGSFVSAAVPDQISKKGSDETLQDAAQPVLSQVSARISAAFAERPLLGNGLLLPATPCVKSFPWLKWQRHATAAGRKIKFEESVSRSGYIGLRRQIADYLNVVRGVKASAEQVQICSGSQQAIYLAALLLLDQGDDILVEEPGYYGVDGALAAVGANKVAVPADEEGFHLEAALQRSGNARLALLTPSRNYPMGYTLSLARRLALLNWAREQDAWIIEDDYDSEFRFDGPPLTSLQGLSGGERVIYMGTFSRILHPSIRLGYLVLPEVLTEPFSQVRAYVDGGLSSLPQIALADFMASGDFASHVRRMRKLYQQRRDILNTLAEQRFGDQLLRVESDGGMHSTFIFRDDLNISDRDLAAAAQARGLGIRALSDFYSSSEGPQGIVIGFAGYDEAQMHRGMDILEDVLHSAGA